VIPSNQVIYKDAAPKGVASKGISSKEIQQANAPSAAHKAGQQSVGQAPAAISKINQGAHAGGVTSPNDGANVARHSSGPQKAAEPSAPLPAAFKANESPSNKVTFEDSSPLEIGSKDTIQKTAEHQVEQARASLSDLNSTSRASEVSSPNDAGNGVRHSSVPEKIAEPSAPLRSKPNETRSKKTPSDEIGRTKVTSSITQLGVEQTRSAFRKFDPGARGMSPPRVAGNMAQHSPIPTKPAAPSSLTGTKSNEFPSKEFPSPNFDRVKALSRLQKVVDQHVEQARSTVSKLNPDTRGSGVSSPSDAGNVARHSSTPANPAAPTSRHVASKANELPSKAIPSKKILAQTIPPRDTEKPKVIQGQRPQSVPVRPAPVERKPREVAVRGPIQTSADEIVRRALAEMKVTNKQLRDAMLSRLASTPTGQPGNAPAQTASPTNKREKDNRTLDQLSALLHELNKLKD